MKNDKKSNIPVVFASILVIALLAVGGWMVLRDTSAPVITIGPETTVVGSNTELLIKISDPGSGLKTVKALIEQNGKTVPLFERAYEQGTLGVEERIKLDKDRLQQGAFTVKVSAQDRSFYPFDAAGKASAEKQFTLDTTAPRIFLLTHINNLNQGGAGFVAFALNEQCEGTGIKVGDRFFPAYLQKSENGKFVYYCLFAIPWDTPPSKFKPMIQASDAAGNTAMKAVPFYANARPFRSDRLNLPDSFIESTLPEFMNELQGKTGAPIDLYLYINNTIRKANRAKLVELGRQTSPTMLWKDTFVRLPNAANRARFADARDYYYGGKKVDHQTHLGLDLASIRQAKVPAGNDGTIVFADNLGIYGNCVIIDHGLGLQTLYAHLSSISVAKGDTVTKGQIVGRTGTTGLAGGDHLHYGVIISGTPVQPIEWWDKNWLENNILSKLQ